MCSLRCSRFLAGSQFNLKVNSDIRRWIRKITPTPAASRLALLVFRSLSLTDEAASPSQHLQELLSSRALSAPITERDPFRQSRWVSDSRGSVETSYTKETGTDTGAFEGFERQRWDMLVCVCQKNHACNSSNCEVQGDN